MTTDKQVKQCRECRGYSLERQWCGHCNGSGFEPDKPAPLYQSEQLLAELAEREWPVTYRRVTEGRGVIYAVYGTSSNNYADALEKELATVTAERDGLKVALSRLMDTCEYWIDHGKQPDMSEEDYKLWLATGHQSDAVLAAKELLRKPLPARQRRTWL